VHADLQAFFFAAAVAVLGYWALPPTRHRERGWWLVVVSAAMVYRASPPAFASAVAMTGVTWATARAIGRRRSVARLTAGIAVLVAVTTAQKLAGPVGSAISLGLSFVLLKSVMVLVDVHRGRLAGEGLSVREVALLNLYFPIYSAGPIQRPEGLVGPATAVRFDANPFAYGLGRVAVGVFKSEFLAGTLLTGFLDSDFAGLPGSVEGYSAGQVYAWLLLRFGVGYLGFSGYSDIAIGLGRMMGLRIMENFRFPLLAENIQEFWQRWHLSLGSFVNRYLFVPMARRSGGRLNLAIFASFLLVGLWHHPSPVYLGWGAGHGAALIWVAELGRFARRRPRLDRWRQTVPYRILAAVVTISFVAGVSSIANAPSVEQAWRLVRRLFGG